ncbi:MAG: hypothetical protein CMM93_05355 [Rickettsiales bacterium]|nr:hypothetical protein [Rickettsiales bacterium]|tara:strand:- start:1757 stop:2545 length:789 start_codon:yes stop_codon:yes gene_type:complete
MSFKQPEIRRGFSLVELSIVLVILGLLTGGILTGQSLIRAAELRSIVTEYQRYQTAARSFQDKYFSIPGDMRNAESFWGTSHANNATCSTTAAVGTATCNGDGDGIIEPSLRANERFRFWQHLANAGLIEGTYTGIEGSSGNTNHAVGGTNAPTSKISMGVWHMQNPCGNCTLTANPSMSDGKHGNIFIIGGGTVANSPSIKILSAEEAWNIDTKIDDGHASTGNLWASWNNCTLGTASNSFLSYNLTASGSTCYLYFRKML